MINVKMSYQPGVMYILLCERGYYYVGSTIDLDRRMLEHFSGIGSNFTKRNPPLELVYVEHFNRIDLAFKREKQIQNWSRAKKEALIKSDFNELKIKSSCINESTHKNNYIDNSTSIK